MTDSALRVESAHANPTRSRNLDESTVRALPRIEDLVVAGMNPFSGGEPDAFLSEAVCLLTVLSQAFDTADDIGDRPVMRSDGLQADNNLDTIRPGIIARALSGVATLVALAQHFENVAAAKRGRA